GSMWRGLDRRQGGGGGAAANSAQTRRGGAPRGAGRWRAGGWGEGREGAWGGVAGSKGRGEPRGAAGSRSFGPIGLDGRRVGSGGLHARDDVAFLANHHVQAERGSPRAATVLRDPAPTSRRMRRLLCNVELQRRGGLDAPHRLTPNPGAR